MKLFCTIWLFVFLLFKTKAVLAFLNEQETEIFTEFIKKYDADEREFRYEIFQQNLQKLRKINDISKNGVKYEINEFTLMTDNELEKMFPGSNNFFEGMKETKMRINPKRKSFNPQIPTSFDWREKNAVTPAKDQQLTKCGSCYAFAVAAAIETAVAIKTGKLIELSEQELVDCDLANYNITLSNNYTLGGCAGGSATNGINYAKNFGLFSEVKYPYIAKTDKCHASSISGNKTFVKGITGPNPFTEDGFTQFIAQNGPLIIGFTVPKSMMSYSSGIMSLTPEECAKEAIGLGHVMVLIGYGVENGIPFFTAKNSFGQKWGENGFMRFRRGINFCNFNTYAASPIY